MLSKTKKKAREAERKAKEEAERKAREESSTRGRGRSGSSATPPVSPRAPTTAACTRCKQEVAIGSNQVCYAEHTGRWGAKQGSGGGWFSPGKTGNAWECCGATSQTAPGCKKFGHIFT